MKLVIPVSKSDVHQLPLLVDVILHHGPITGHDILLYPTPGVQEDAMKAAARLREVCKDVAVEIAEEDFGEGWPIAPNRHWHSLVIRLERMGNRLPWLWLEVDSVPMKPHWVNDLWNSYVAAGKPFFGFTKPVTFLDANKVPFTKPKDDIMMGVAIYPPGIPKDELILPLFNNVGRRGVSGLKTPFDLYLRWVFKRRGVASTTAIVDRWRTCNYRLEGDVIHCDPMPGEDRAKAGTVPPEAVLVHGSKDGSLHKLVMGGGKKPEKQVQLVEPEQKQVGGKPVAEAAKPILVIPPAPPTTALLTYVSSSKVRIKDVEKKFEFMTTLDAIVALKAIGYTVKTGGWVSKNQEDEV